jgi:pimeloyl-ACP methyl ester carboxylesterase
MTCGAFFLLFLLAIIGFSCTSGDPAPVREVSFGTADGGRIFADRYGQGDHGVVLAHGAVFDKGSWAPIAEELSNQGFTVLAIDFRGYGKSTSGKERKALHKDLLAAVRYLRSGGIPLVSLIGASMGGGAAAQAAVEAKAGEIDRLILLSPVPIKSPENMTAGKILFIASKEEGNMATVKKQYERSPKPKSLYLLDGDAHAQHIFKTDQSKMLTDRLVAFLSESTE